MSKLFFNVIVLLLMIVRSYTSSATLTSTLTSTSIPMKSSISSTLISLLSSPSYQPTSSTLSTSLSPSTSPFPPPLTQEELVRVQQSERRLRATGSLEFISLFAVLSTLLYWPNIYRGKPFMILIFWISTLDFIASIAILFGYPTGILCNIQGFVLFLFYRTSWILTALLSIELFGLVIYRRLFLLGKGIIRSLTIIFLINVIVTCLPFIDNDSYGLEARLQGTYSCGLDKNSNANGVIWTLALNTAPLFVVLTIMLVMIAATTIKYFKIPKDDPYKRKLLTGMFTINLYLWCMFIFWLPNIVANMYCAVNSSHSSTPNSACLYYLDISISIAPLHGVFMSIIYFWRTAEPKRLIHKALKKYVFPQWEHTTFESDGSEIHHDINNEDETVTRITLDGQFFMVYNRSMAVRIDEQTQISANRIGDVELHIKNPINRSIDEASRATMFMKH